MVEDQTSLADITGDGNIAGDENIAQTVKAEAGGSISNVTQITADVVYQVYAQASALSAHIRVREFRSLVTERTRGFVGREFIIKAIGDLLRDPEFPSGYIVVSGEPGIGKTALIAQLVKQTGHVHHFNISSQNIRSAADFLGNVCAQLILRYGLKHAILPDGATKDSGFLCELLAEATARPEAFPVVILVDALDESEDSDLVPGANRLYLPRTLPNGVYFVVTTREKADYRLLVDWRKDIYLREDDPNNLEDVRQYISNAVAEHPAQMEMRIQQWGLSNEEFVTVLTEKSEGNFMYLVYVLRDIREGRLGIENIDDIYELPQGLRAYYQRHWRAMRAQEVERFERYYQPVVCLLATAREPVSVDLISEWTKLPLTRVKQVIDEWREFLNVDVPEQGSPLYRVYHTSFQDFLKDEVGLKQYHKLIAQSALDKIRW